jgi:exoribonuclease R
VKYGYQFYPAVIHSAARLTYTEVAAIREYQRP